MDEDQTSGEVAPYSPSDVPPQGQRGNRLAPWQQLQLCRELATGDYRQVDLAAKYGITQPSVSQFAKRHAERIAAIREQLDDEFAGLWVAQKRNRIAEYQSDVERINAKAQKDGATMADADMLRVKGTFLKSVAEELGQLPARVNVSVSPVVHILEGVQPEELT